MMTRTRALPIALAIATSLGACSGGGAGGGGQPPGAAQGIEVQVSPLAPQVAPAGSVAFTALVTGTIDTSVKWSVSETSGGTIDVAGLYVAPASVGTYHVVARAAADQTVTATATVTVTTTTPPPPPPATNTCATEPVRTTGTVRYFCNCDAGAAAGCVNGNDSNSGTSPSTPWRSFSKAASTFASMKAGDTVAFCKGGSWQGVAGLGTYRNTACNSASSTCDMRDYAAPWNTGSEGKPVIQLTSGSDFIQMGWWQNYSQTPLAGFRFLNLDLVAGGGGPSAFYIWGSVTDVEVCNTTIRDGFNVGINPVTASTTKRLTFHFNRLTNNYGQGGETVGLVTGGCDDFVIDSNYFDHNGSGTAHDHSIYLGTNPEPAGNLSGVGGTYYVTSRIRFTNNQIYRSSRGSGSSCFGSVIEVHEPHDDMVIENNLVYEQPGTADAGCYGIQLSSGLDAPGAWRRALIRRNRIFNVGGNGIAVSECQDCVIDSNLIVLGSQTDTGIKYPEESSSVAAGSLASARGIVRNNTIYGAPVGSYGLNVGHVEGSGYVVANNAVAVTGSGMTAFYVANATQAGNLSTSTASAAWFSAPGSDPATADFTPAAGSPLVNAGSTTYFAPVAVGTAAWSPSDTGKARDAAPDVGAGER